MRDIQITTSTYNNRLSRHLSFLEEFAGSGTETKVEKNWIYTVKDKAKISNRADLCEWAKRRKKDSGTSSLKFLSILKTRNTKLHEEGFNLTAVGQMQVVNEGVIFFVEYFYSLRISMKRSQQNEKTVNGI